MKISVILCTYNRCRSLEKALASVSLSTMPNSVEWDVLVVDNNSHDQTRAVVENYCQKHPKHFRYLFEPHPGKSYALNSGIREANADVLAFMDDDVEVDPNWLHNLTAPLNNEQWAGTGGRILPESAFTPPRWLDTSGRYGLAPLAMFDLGMDACELREAPFGTNMAFRKEMFAKYGGFRTDLGPQPGSQIRNEDVEFGDRLLAAGERFGYEPAAVVYHAISQSRLNKGYFLAWWFDKARADVRQFGTPKDAKWRISGVPLNLLRRLCAWTVRWISSANPRQRFSCKLKVWGIMGSIQECHRQYASAAQAARITVSGVAPTRPGPDR